MRSDRKSAAIQATFEAFGFEPKDIAVPNLIEILFEDKNAWTYITRTNGQTSLDLSKN